MAGLHNISQCVMTVYKLEIVEPSSEYYLIFQRKIKLIE